MISVVPTGFSGPAGPEEGNMDLTNDLDLSLIPKRNRQHSTDWDRYPHRSGYQPSNNRTRFDASITVVLAWGVNWLARCFARGTRSGFITDNGLRGLDLKLYNVLQRFLEGNLEKNADWKQTVTLLWRVGWLGRFIVCKNTAREVDVVNEFEGWERLVRVLLCRMRNTKNKMTVGIYEKVFFCFVFCLGI